MITDQAAAPARVTLDVDVVVHVMALSGYHKVEQELADRGFRRDMQDAPICRWVYESIEFDLVPTQRNILGFSNRWYPLALETAQDAALPSGMRIRLITAPAFLGTKFEAFMDRGQRDLLASHDLEDIINVIDGRPELLDEIEQAPPELRDYLGVQCGKLLAMPDFADRLPGMVLDDSSLERTALVDDRLHSIAGRKP